MLGDDHPAVGQALLSAACRRLAELGDLVVTCEVIHTNAPALAALAAAGFERLGAIVSSYRRP